MQVSGFLGTHRWYQVGDATGLEASLALAGFASLLLVALFELDVVPERFLEVRLILCPLHYDSCFFKIETGLG